MFKTLTKDLFNRKAVDDKALKVKDYGIEKVFLTLNWVYTRETDDWDLGVIDAYNRTKLMSKDLNFLLTSSTRNLTHVDHRKDYYDSGNEPPGLLYNLFIDVETKTMRGQNKESSLTTKRYKMTDFDWDTDPYLPTLDITDHISVLGDYFADTEAVNRTITTVKLTVDYETLVYKAYKSAKKYFNKLCSGGKYDCEDEVCGEYRHPAHEGKGLYDEKKKKIFVRQMG